MAQGRAARGMGGGLGPTGMEESSSLPTRRNGTTGGMREREVKWGEGSHSQPALTWQVSLERDGKGRGKPRHELGVTFFCCIPIPSQGVPDKVRASPRREGEARRSKKVGRWEEKQALLPPPTPPQQAPRPPGRSLSLPEPAESCPVLISGGWAWPSLWEHPEEKGE